MVKGFRTLTSKDMGFDRNHVLTFHVVLPDGNTVTKIASAATTIRFCETFRRCRASNPRRL